MIIFLSLDILTIFALDIRSGHLYFSINNNKVSTVDRRTYSRPTRLRKSLLAATPTGRQEGDPSSLGDNAGA